MFYKRASFLFLLITGFFTVLLFNIFRISYTTGDRFAAAAQVQQRYSVTAGKSSGTIYDCALRKITNTASKNVAIVVSGQITDIPYAAKMLAAFSEGGEEAMARRIASGQPFSVELAAKLPETQGILQFEIPYTEEGWLPAQHLIGYARGDGRAVTGALKSFGELLEQAGGKISATFLTDAARRQFTGEDYQLTNTIKENGIALSIDAEIQLAVEAAAAGIKKGAVVITDIRSGKLLSSVSKPDYNPRNIAQYLDSSDGELINRALLSYDAGSVFKLVVLAAYLEKNGELPEFKVTCEGSVKLGDTVFGCHKRSGHGELGIEDAVAQSCNIYFYELAKTIGVDAIIDEAERFGIGQSRPLAEGITAAAGRLPERKSRPTLSYIANIAIGQGGIMMSPLDVAYTVSVIANGGSAYPIRFLEGTVKDGVLSAAPRAEAKQVIRRETADIIRDLMIYTVEEGTGTSAKPLNGGAGGKTASAETGWKIDGENVIHGWFCGFYPAQNPRYAIAVIVENGRSGATAAAPVFKEICARIAAIEESGYLKG